MLRKSELRAMLDHPLFHGLTNKPERDKDLHEAIKAGLVEQHPRGGFALTSKGRAEVATKDRRCPTCGKILVYGEGQADET